MLQSVADEWRNEAVPLFAETLAKFHGDAPSHLVRALRLAQLEVSAWPEPPSAIPAGPSEGVRLRSVLLSERSTQERQPGLRPGRVRVDAFVRISAWFQSEQFCSDTAEGGEYEVT